MRVADFVTAKNLRPAQPTSMRDLGNTMQAMGVDVASYSSLVAPITVRRGARLDWT